MTKMKPFDPDRICRACLSDEIRITVNQYANLDGYLRCACHVCGYAWTEAYPTQEQYEEAKENAGKGLQWLDEEE